MGTLLRGKDLLYAQSVALPVGLKYGWRYKTNWSAWN